MRQWLSVVWLVVLSVVMSSSLVWAADDAVKSPTHTQKTKSDAAVVPNKTSSPEASATAETAGKKLGEDSKLPLPRFASLRARETNLRSGPGKRYPILWVYKRGFVPVEIIDELEDWRRVRDIAGDSGWLHRSLLSGNRTAMFVTGLHNVYAHPDATTAPIFRIKEGVIVHVEQCSATWCRIEFSEHQGWVEKNTLFGVYAAEVF